MPQAGGFFDGPSERIAKYFGSPFMMAAARLLLLNLFPDRSIQGGYLLYFHLSISNKSHAEKR
jgi:hypothetical protein